MANPYSNPNLYFQIAPVDPTNWDLALKTLAYKQGQYDSNKMRIEDMVQKYLSTDIKKPEVKQRFANNIQSLINEINEVGATDFSDPNIANRIMSHIGQALDEPVMNAIQVSRMVDKEEASIAELQKKNIALYSSINHQDMYMTKGTDGVSYNDWLNDGRDDTTFRGNIRYTPFSDYQGKVDKQVKELMKMNKDTQIEMLVPPELGGDGIRTEKYKISGLTENQLRQIVEYSMTSPDDKAQMAIDSRAKYNWYQTEEDILRLQNDVTAFTANSINSVDIGIQQLELTLAQEEEGSAGYIQKSNDLQRLKNNRAYYESLGSNLSAAKSPQEFDVAATQVFASQFSDSMVNKYASLYNKTFLGFGVDEYGKDARDFKYKVEKDRLDRELKAAEAASKAADRAAAAQEKAAEKAEKDQYRYITLPDETTFENGATLETKFAEEKDKVLGNITGTSISYLNDLDNIVATGGDADKVTEAKGLLKLYRSKLANEMVRSGMTIADAVATLDGMNSVSKMQEYDPTGAIFYDVLESSGGKSLLTIVNRDGVDYYDAISNNMGIYTTMVDAQEELIKAAKKSLIPSIEDQQKVVDNLMKSGYQYVGRDNKLYNIGKALLLDTDVFDSNGKLKPGKSLTDSKYYTRIEWTYKALELLEESSKKRTNNLLAFPPESADKIREISALIGDDYSIATKKDSLWKISGQGVKTAKEDYIVVDPESKTGKMLISVSKIENKYFGDDENLLKDGKFRNVFWGAKDYRNDKAYQDDMEKLVGKLATPNVVSVSTTTEEGKALVRAINSSRTTSDDASASIKEGFDLQFRLNDDGTVKMSQKRDYGGKVGVEVTDLGSFSRETLTQFPDLMERVNWEKSKEFYTRQAVQDNPITSSPIKYWTQRVPDKNANAVLGSNIYTKAMLRSDSAEQVVKESMLNYVDMVQNVDPNFPQKLKSAFANSDKFYISATIENEGLGDVGVFTLREVDSGRIIHTIKEPNIRSLDESVRIIKQTPQVLYTTMMIDIITDNYNRNSTPDVRMLGMDREFTPAYQKIFTTN